MTDHARHGEPDQGGPRDRRETSTSSGVVVSGSGYTRRRRVRAAWRACRTEVRDAKGESLRRGSHSERSVESEWLIRDHRTVGRPFGV